MKNSIKVPSTALSGNFDPHVQICTLRSKFPCRLVSGTFIEFYPSWDKRGFTLVEILIVIFIVALLSVLAIGGYSEYRKLTLLNYSADSVVSQIMELKDRVVYGIENEVVDENIVSKCTGILFESNSNLTNRLSVEYSAKKRWDDIKNEWVQGNCNIDDSTAWEKIPFELDQDVEFENAFYVARGIKYGVSTDTILLFVPYDGKVLLKEILSNLPLEADEIGFEIKYTNSEDAKFKRVIKIDLKSGTAKWEYYE